MSPIRRIAQKLPACRSLPVPAAGSCRGSAALLLGLLATAVAVQNVAWVVLLRSTGWRWPHPAAVFAIGLALASIGMAGLWLALARSPFWQRGLLVLGAVLLGGPVAAHATSGLLMHWWVATAVYAAITALPLAAARFAGVHLPAENSDAAPDPRTRQFTIRGILVLTTSAAVLLGVGRVLDFPWRQMGETALFGLALGLIPWVVGLGRLRAEKRSRPVLAAVVVCPLAGWLIDLTGFPPPNQIGLLIALTSVQGVLTLGMAEILRLAGQRLHLPG